MAAAVDSAWSEHALATLREAGLRRGGARVVVVEALARHDCAVSPLQLDEEVPEVGRATVYRTLDQLEELGLIKRIELTPGTAAFERVELSGHHHHHAVCRNCGRTEAFEDRALERDIARLAKKASFEITEHDVVLRGLCPRCAG